MTLHDHTAETCREWGYKVPGWWCGSGWDWVPCPDHAAPPEPLEPGEIRVTLSPR